MLFPLSQLETNEQTRQFGDITPFIMHNTIIVCVHCRSLLFACICPIHAEAHCKQTENRGEQNIKRANVAKSSASSFQHENSLKTAQLKLWA